MTTASLGTLRATTGAGLRMLSSADPLARRLRPAPKDPGNALLAALGNADFEVLARAARTAGELRRHNLMQELRRYRSHEHAPLRF